MTEFNYALASAAYARCKQPLPYGIYKLKEKKAEIRKVLDELNRLKELKTGRPTLMHCTKREAPAWVAGQVLDIPRFLGYDTLPAIDAAVKTEGLAVSKITDSKIERILEAIEQLYARLVPNLDKTAEQFQPDPRVVWLFGLIETLIAQVLP